MIQIALRNFTLNKGSRCLIAHANLFIEKGARVGIIGRNGVGKSSLLQVLLGDITLDQGTYEKPNNLTIAQLPQNIPTHLPGTIEQIVQGYLPQTQTSDWQDLSLAAKIISQLKLPGTCPYSDLSGGLKRLTLFACALAQQPDVLLLDEPTNHLDIDSIERLETFLLSTAVTIIFITHDRQLLQKIASKIVEIDNCTVISWQGNYHDYLKHRETQLEAEAKANALFDKKLAQEESWLRQGIKARRTRNEGRVKLLKQMRLQRQQRQNRPGNINIQSHSLTLSGKIIFDIQNINYLINNRYIVRDFSSLILRGEKIGIVGSNGIGKTTLINLILGIVSPSSGTIKHGTLLNVGYYDQNRLQLPLEKTVLECVCELGDSVIINGQEKHIYSYLQDFLFSPLQARSLIKDLSGGERNRVMLAKLLAQPHNVLVLDEPTNDLDLETLELLEDYLVSYSGTVLLISHDRTFLNNIVTSTLVFRGGGHIEELLGGYDSAEEKLKTPLKEKKADKAKPIPSQKKLSYKEQQELSNLPGKIETLEQQRDQLNQLLADGTFYKQQQEEIGNRLNEVSALEQQIEDCYARWEELESRK